MNPKQKPELLAPAGTLQTVAAVIEAGADAVYLGGKSFNMRQHRSSYNLDEDGLGKAIVLAHDRGKKIYYTLNSLMLDKDLDVLRQELELLGRLAPDALIVQDLAVAALAREICVQLPLHASTMMNIHSVASAMALRMMGFTRVISSRDIPLHQVRRIGEVSGLEMEYFVHGDMCVAHSSQCHLSGIMFGKSSNRGLCVKPCRWRWKLIASDQQAKDSLMHEGYLLARKDLCLFGHIPALVHNGIVSLKIEGRMRTAEFLVPIVAAYRQAVDGYFADPVHYVADADTMARLWSKRVREYTTSHTFANAGPVSIDTSGKREPRLFSLKAPPVTVTDSPVSQSGGPMGDLELVVHVSGAQSAQAAIDAGASAIYLGGDGFRGTPAGLNVGWLKRFTADMAKQQIRVAVLGPRISDERDLDQWRWLLEQLATIDDLWLGVSSLGALQVTQEMGVENILADFSLNVANSVAADELSTMGAKRITASIELNLEELQIFATKTGIPVEIIGQGPLAGMLLEHCLIAAAKGYSSQDVCTMDCHTGRFELEDISGQRFSLQCDRRCRNHLYSSADLCALGNLAVIGQSPVQALRIEAHRDSPAVVAEVVRTYRQALDALGSGLDFDVQKAIGRICSATGRPLSDGAFNHPRTALRTKELKRIAAKASGS